MRGPILDAAARGLHAVHGTRGLTASVGVLLVWTLLEPGLGAGFPHWLVVVPAFAVLVVAVVTLPREAVAVQERAHNLIDRARPARVLARRAVWLVALLVLLLPRLFLGAYGVPHMSPLTGVIDPQWQGRIATAYLFLVLWMAVGLVRSSRLEAPAVQVRRPAALRDASGSHLRRQGHQAAIAVILAAWLWLLAPFWAPFSLFTWPPGLESLASARGVASMAYSVVPPAVLYVALAGHLEFLWLLWRRHRFRGRWGDAATAASMAAGAALAAVLHARGLLWIVAYGRAGTL